MKSKTLSVAATMSQNWSLDGIVMGSDCAKIFKLETIHAELIRIGQARHKSTSAGGQVASLFDQNHSSKSGQRVPDFLPTGGHFYKGRAVGGFIWFCFLHLPENKSVASMRDRSCQGQLRSEELEREFANVPRGVLLAVEVLLTSNGCSAIIDYSRS